MSICDALATRNTGKRSEEHTSELQSQSNLVCRLLLEKKKNITKDLFEFRYLIDIVSIGHFVGWDYIGYAHPCPATVLPSRDGPQLSAAWSAADGPSIH